MSKATGAFKRVKSLSQHPSNAATSLLREPRNAPLKPLNLHRSAASAHPQPAGPSKHSSFSLGIADSFLVIRRYSRKKTQRRMVLWADTFKNAQLAQEHTPIITRSIHSTMVIEYAQYGKLIQPFVVGLCLISLTSQTRKPIVVRLDVPSPFDNSENQGADDLTIK